jgi:hypothetical protein
MSDLLWLFFGVLAVLALAAIAVPISVLMWWAGWRRRADPLGNDPALAAPLGSTEGHSTGPALGVAAFAASGSAAAPSCGPFLVYFSGVGDISDVYQSRYEDELLEAVAQRVDGLVVITDVFGFSVDNLSMTSQRRLGWFWTWVNDVRLRKDSPLKRVGMLINLRNILHISVSADGRYGPVYNYGVAEMTLQSLLRHGYILGSGVPIALLGFSGGAQIALAAAGYVTATLRAPVQVITMGGIMNSSPSLRTITRLTLLYGTGDRLQWLPDWIFPARWPFWRNSEWNRALKEGKLRRICLGRMGHTKRNSYLDGTVYAPDGRSYRDVTADAIAGLLAGAST